MRSLVSHPLWTMPATSLFVLPGSFTLKVSVFCHSTVGQYSQASLQHSEVMSWECRNALQQHFRKELLIPWGKHQEVLPSGVRSTRTKHWQAGYCCIPHRQQRMRLLDLSPPQLLVTKAERKPALLKSSDVLNGDTRTGSVAEQIQTDWQRLETRAHSLLP